MRANQVFKEMREIPIKVFITNFIKDKHDSLILQVAKPQVHLH